MIAAETALAHPSARCIAVVKHAAEAEQQQPAMAWFPKLLDANRFGSNTAVRWIQQLNLQQCHSNVTASKPEQQQLQVVECT
jgi:hypothetical protein